MSKGLKRLVHKASFVLPSTENRYVGLENIWHGFYMVLNSPLVPLRHSAERAIPGFQEKTQLALAVADQMFLRELLTDSLPAIAHPHEIRSLTIEVGVPLPAVDYGRIDAVIQFEQMKCVLAGSAADVPPVPEFASHSQYKAVTKCHSELTTLAKNIPLSVAISLLSNAGFAEDQIGQILQLPSQAWHKSWWYSADIHGNLTIPFQRLMRTKQFADGTFTLQFKDYYPYEKPEEFRSQVKQVAVLIQQPRLNFGDVLYLVNLSRRELAIDHAILLAEELSDIEIEGYIRQHISLWNRQAIQLPIDTNCRLCHQENCPLQGTEASPVMVCRAFMP
jgi:hypothetical protein